MTDLREVMKSSYCPLVFHGLYVRRFTGEEQLVAPCCLAEKSEQFRGQQDLMNHQYLEGIRNDVRKNKRSKACTTCWVIEDQGGQSPRKIALGRFLAKNLPISLEQSEEKLNECYSIDYNVLPLCNAKCIICSWEYSSLWAAEAGVKIISGDELKYDHLSKTNLDNIKRIYFNGGEPLLTNEHLTVLKKIKDLNTVEISYNTNGSIYPNQQTLDLWYQAKSVDIHFSIDGIGKRFEETRTPLKWDKVSDVIQRVNLLEGINISCAYTIGKHNVFDLEETINWFASLPNFNVLNQVHVHTVYGELGLEFATSAEKAEFKQELEKYADKFYWYTNIVNSF